MAIERNSCQILNSLTNVSATLCMYCDMNGCHHGYSAYNVILYVLSFMTCTYSYRRHPLIKFVERKQPLVKDSSESCEAGEADGGKEPGESDETSEVDHRSGGVEETDFMCPDNEGTDTSGFSIKNQKALPLQRYRSKMSETQEYLETSVKRPNFCCVLIGRHWSVALSKGML